jgi:hypothetical protein
VPSWMRDSYGRISGRRRPVEAGHPELRLRPRDWNRVTTSRVDPCPRVTLKGAGRRRVTTWEVLR